MMPIVKMLYSTEKTGTHKGSFVENSPHEVWV